MIELEKIAIECHAADIPGFMAKIDLLHQLLLEENKKVNLTRITSRDEFLIKHVIDSLLIGKFFPELATKQLSVVDIGCGAGFPSLILALAYPGLHLTAMDSIAKKTAFVVLAGEKLNLTNLEVVTGRSKELNHRADFQKRFDIVTARAVAEAKTVFLEAKQFPKRNGRFILYKTPEQLIQDLPAIRQADSIHKWHTTSIYELPEQMGARQFLYSSI